MAKGVEPRALCDGVSGRFKVCAVGAFDSGPNAMLMRTIGVVGSGQGSER
jgi:hypothetical protein